MSKIRIDDKLERLLIQAGMVKEIPISDKEVVEALRKNGFSFEKALPAFKRVQWTFWNGKNLKPVVSFTPGEIKAVVDEITLFEIEKIANGKIVFGIYYEINGFVSSTIKALKKVKDMLNVKPRIVRARL